MLKSVLYYLILLTTGLRLIDMVYLLTRATVNLPVPVIFTTIAMIVYGAILLLRRFLSSVRLRPMMVFFIVQTAVMLFNIACYALTSPLVPDVLETFAIGSFLEILINVVVVYQCLRKLRARSIVTVGQL